MAATRKRETYHHGDARNALLRAAWHLLDTVGASGLSLRQAAEQAGLSRQAPYNHFSDKEALLAELVGEGFARLGRDLIAAGSGAGPPVDHLARAGAAYIGFAEAHPALFRLMFSRELIDIDRYPAAKQAATASFAALTAIIATLTSGSAVAELSLAAWSVVHGYATLRIEAGIEPAGQREARAALFARMIAAAG